MPARGVADAGAEGLAAFSKRAAEEDWSRSGRRVDGERSPAPDTTPVPGRWSSPRSGEIGFRHGYVAATRLRKSFDRPTGGLRRPATRYRRCAANATNAEAVWRSAHADSMLLRAMVSSWFLVRRAEGDRSPSGPRLYGHQCRWPKTTPVPGLRLVVRFRASGSGPSAVSEVKLVWLVYALCVLLIWVGAAAIVLRHG